MNALDRAGDSPAELAAHEATQNARASYKSTAANGFVETKPNIRRPF